MQLDFEIQRATRHCSATERELRPGEWFYSVLQADGESIVRRDFASESWSGPPDNHLGWWKSKVPDATVKRFHLAPNDVILQYFSELKVIPKKPTCGMS